MDTEMEVSPVRDAPGFRPAVRRGSSFDRFIPHRPSLNLEGAHHLLLQGFQSSHSAASAATTATATSSDPPFAARQGEVNNRSNMTTNNTTHETGFFLDGGGSLDDSVFLGSGGGGGVGGGAANRQEAMEYQRRLSAAMDTGEGAVGGGGSSRILNFSCNTPPFSPALAHFASHHGSDFRLDSPRRDSSGLGSPSPYSPARRIRSEPDTVLLLPITTHRNSVYVTLMDWGRNNVIAAGVDSGADIWNAGTGKSQHIEPRPNDDRWRRHAAHVTSVQWDPPGRNLALGYCDGSVLMWDSVAMTISGTFSMPKQSKVNCLAWLRSTLFCGTSSGRVYQLDLRENTPQPTKCPSSHKKDVCSLQLSPDESTLACGGDDGDICLWEPRATSVTSRIHAHVSGAKALAWCPWRRNILASGGGLDDKHIRLWSVSACTVKTEINTNMQVSSVLWSEEYREMVSAQGFENSHSIAVWSTRDLNLQVLGNLAPPLKRTLHQSLSPDGTTLASFSVDGRLRLWKLFPRKRRPPESVSPLNLDRCIR